uniref:Uncharacterized protein n=1 Tax=Auriscalpium vulgare TaxID=40419 RepID=A0ACB8RJN3_9AGAM|nr:hypothetical protein FA95DRAFT_1497273 [Auriscalpium vulgare]
MLRSSLFVLFTRIISGDRVVLARQGTAENLNKMGLYDMAFVYLKDFWKDEVSLVPDAGDWEGDVEPFFSNRVRSFASCFVNEMRFGACTNYRGKGYSYAYIDDGVPVKIQYIFQATHLRRDPTKDDLTTTFAFVQRFLPDATVFPWHTRYANIYDIFTC